MTEYGMGDDATIEEILNDVDTNKVTSTHTCIHTYVYICVRVCMHAYAYMLCVVFLQMTEYYWFNFCAGWKYQLRGV